MINEADHMTKRSPVLSAPARANSMAVAWPIPESDPVTTAMLPESVPIFASSPDDRWDKGHPTDRTSTPRPRTQVGVRYGASSKYSSRSIGLSSFPSYDPRCWAGGVEVAPMPPRPRLNLSRSCYVTRLSRSADRALHHHRATSVGTATWGPAWQGSRSAPLPCTR